MLRYIGKRIINLIPVALIISVLIFVLSKAMPGDPLRAMIPQDGRMTKAQQEELYKNLEHRYGYDRSLPEQYVYWMGRTLNGAFGESTHARESVSTYLAEPLRNSIYLNLGS